jgi:poly-gamma-glutamate synthesis protein (capsule biosynthesis protein)
MDRVRPLFQGADIVFGNLEAVLSRIGLREDKLSTVQMRGDPRFANDLRALGFTVLNLANNHSFQHGRAAFEESCGLLTAAGITCCGLRGEAPWESEPAIVQCQDGTLVGFLGYCLRPPQFHTDQVAPFAEGSEETILEVVQRLAPRVSAVVVSLHWGEEFVSTPSSEEVRFAHNLLDAGGTLVLGHHPHVLRPLELRGNGLVAYSLGNFIGDQTWHSDLRRGGILECQLVDGGVRQAHFHPTRLLEDMSLEVALETQPIPASPPVALSDASYRSESSQRLTAIRRAKYRYTIRHLASGNPRFLFQLGLSTIRNRLTELVRK